MVKKKMVHSAGCVAFCLVVLLWLPSQSHAASHESITTITRLYTYAEFGGGDVMIQVATPPAGCAGFWLRATDPGFKTVYAALLSAYYAGASLRIGGDDAIPWAGSGSVYCKIDYAVLVPG